MILQIAEQIKKLRTDRRLTQSELAKKLKVSRSAVNAWEQGTNNPALSYVAEIADIFGVSLDYLVGGGDNKVDVSDLSTEEQEAVRRVISCFKAKNY
jgi:transcriptional regulator with XRE-family HTH domain